MRKRSSKLICSKDEALIASRIVHAIAGLKIGDKNPAAMALGRLGGRRGGPARAQKLSARKRHEIAKKPLVYSGKNSAKTRTDDCSYCYCELISREKLKNYLLQIEEKLNGDGLTLLGPIMLEIDDDTLRDAVDAIDNKQDRLISARRGMGQRPPIPHGRAPAVKDQAHAIFNAARCRIPPSLPAVANVRCFCSVQNPN
jgi:hypothetical protein